MRYAFSCWVALVLLAALASSPAAAAPTTFSDRSLFISATGARSAQQPVLGDQGVIDLGEFTIVAVPFPPEPTVNQLAQVRDWSTLIPGNEITIAGQEWFDVNFRGDATFFGFDFHEPTTAAPEIDGCNFTSCVDSTFQVSLFAGPSEVGSFSFNRPDDVLAFVGVLSDVPFDRIAVRETVGNFDNEFFGNFLVPEPPMGVLTGMGLVVLGVLTRSRRSIA